MPSMALYIPFKIWYEKQKGHFSGLSNAQMKVNLGMQYYIANTSSGDA